MCSFSTYTLPSGIYGTALSDANWDGSENCGRCVKVNYGSKSLTAMVWNLPIIDALCDLCVCRSQTNAPAAAQIISTSIRTLSQLSPMPQRV